MKNRNSPLGNHTESKEPHCQIYHYDLYGKRKDKYNFLYENGLDSIPWNRLNPKPPFFLFIPQNEGLREEYDKGISVKDMFRISSVGITSGNDKFCISDSDTQKSLQEFKQKILYFLTLDEEQAKIKFDIKNDEKSSWQIIKAKKDIEITNNNSNNYVKIHYRPFDYRWTYYTGKSKGFHCMPRGEVMEHFLQDSKNKALLVSRQASAIGEKNFDAIFISDKMVDINLYRRGGEQVMPLYLKNTESAKNKLKKGEQGTLELESKDIFNGQERIENFTPEFRAFVDSKYTWNLKDIKANPHLFLESNTLTPEAILGYIYAVLFHKDYREKYIDFLKIDFPKIPFVESKEKFIALSKLGLELMSVHLMADNEREREQKLMRMNRNIGLTISRRTIIHGSWQFVWIVEMITELGFLGDYRGGGHIFPLYLYNTKRARKILCKE